MCPRHTNTLEDFKFEAQPTINRLLISELMRGEYLEKRESVIFIGHPGTGKTHLATVLGIAACGQCKKVRFHRVTELITQLMEARKERQLMRMKAQLAKLDLLILDELDYVPASKLGSELLFDVISAAYERTSSIIVTTMVYSKHSNHRDVESDVHANAPILTTSRPVIPSDLAVVINAWEHLSAEV